MARVQTEYPDRSVDPFEYLLRVSIDDAIPHDVRIDAAKSIRKAVHPDLQTTTLQGADGGPIEVAAVQLMAQDPRMAELMEQLALAAVVQQNRITEKGPVALLDVLDGDTEKEPSDVI